MKKTAIILSLIFAVAIVLSVSIPTPAANTAVAGHISAAIDVTAPATADIGSIIPGAGVNASLGGNVVVNCNRAWTLVASANSSGHMTNGSVSLVNALFIAGGTMSGYLSLATNQTVQTGGKGTTTISNLQLGQAATYSDWYGDYNILITFTGTMN